MTLFFIQFSKCLYQNFPYKKTYLEKNYNIEFIYNIRVKIAQKHQI